mmetsp:Transcript_25228/g.69344  ORF Transcript_25228/g.69344 Transcript_25228/m.69344 type:complete len:943 (-) Transcript_25228:21-2849(-)
MRADYSDACQMGPRHVELKYTKFRISGIPGEKHAVFIPDGLKLSHPVLSQICGALHKEMPNMLLSGMSSLRHPARMSTKQLRESEGFKPLMNDAMSSLGMLPHPAEERSCSFNTCGRDSGADHFRSTELRLTEEDPTRDSLADVANRVLEKKIGSMVCAAASAAQRANAWIFSGPQISAFEVFLQQGIEADEIDVFRLVAAHVQDRAYMECETSRNLMKFLFDSSEAMSHEVVCTSKPVTLSGDLWNPAKSTTHREFMEHGFEYWSFESHDDEMCNGHPITQWPWPHADLFFLFYREEPSIDGAQSSDADWEFKTKWKLDREAIPFSPDVLAPVGYVFIGGNELQMKRKLLQAMRVSSPVVILDNTPNVPKQIALFANVVQKVWGRAPMIACEPFLADGAGSQLGGNPSSTDLLEAILPSKIMNYVEKEFDNSGMDDAEKLTLSDIVGLMDLVKRRPQTFRETVCVVDPLRHTPDRIMSQLISVMSSFHSGARELHKLNTTAIHRSLVMKGWRLHRKLARRAVTLRELATFMVVAIALLMVLSTTLAVWMVSIRLQSTARPGEVTYNFSVPVLTEEIELSFTLTDELSFLKISLLVLPIVVGLLTTLQSHFHISQKWASVHMAATMTVSEIYQFLGNVGPYCNGAHVNQRRFMKRLQDMVKHLSMSGVLEDDLMDSSTDGSDSFPQDPEALEEHVNQYLYGVRPVSWFLRKVQDCMASLGGCGPSCAWTALLMDGQNAKDLAAPLTAESYMETRVLPLRKYYSSWVRTTSTVRMILNIFLVLCLSVGSGLGASGFSLWIPVTLAAATFMTTLIHWLAPSEILTAVNNAMATLNNLDLRWHGSDIRETRSEANKVHLITTTEKLSCAVAITFSGASMMPEELDDTTFEESDAAYYRLGEGKRSGSRSNPISVSVTPYGRSGSATPNHYMGSRGRSGTATPRLQ